MSLSRNSDGKGTAEEPWSLQGAHTIVTGGNRGIGLEVTRGLIAQGAHVIIGCRDTEGCQAACGELLRSLAKVSPSGTPLGTCTCSSLDLGDFNSVRNFAKTQKEVLQKNGAQLKVLVNNAGVMGVTSPSCISTPAAPPLETHMAVNHCGPFLLTRLLQDSLSTKGRVVNVASRAHYMGELQWSEGRSEPAGGGVDKAGLGAGGGRRGDGLELKCFRGNWYRAYCQSKLANVVFTAELQRRWGESPQQIKAVSISPGFVSTGIFNSLPWPLHHVSSFLAGMIARTPAQGAETVLYAATCPSLSGSSKELFLHDSKPLTPLGEALKPEQGQLLWDWTSRMVGMDP